MLQCKKEIKNYLDQMRLVTFLNHKGLKINCLLTSEVFASFPQDVRQTDTVLIKVTQVNAKTTN
jgi:hypothetical protein